MEITIHLIPTIIIIAMICLATATAYLVDRLRWKSKLESQRKTLYREINFWQENEYKYYVGQEVKVKKKDGKHVKALIDKRYVEQDPFHIDGKMGFAKKYEVINTYGKRLIVEEEDIISEYTPTVTVDLQSINQATASHTFKPGQIISYYPIKSQTDDTMEPTSARQTAIVVRQKSNKELLALNQNKEITIDIESQKPKIKIERTALEHIGQLDFENRWKQKIIDKYSKEKNTAPNTISNHPSRGLENALVDLQSTNQATASHTFKPGQIIEYYATEDQKDYTMISKTGKQIAIVVRQKSNNELLALNQNKEITIDIEKQKPNLKIENTLAFVLNVEFEKEFNKRNKTETFKIKKQDNSWVLFSQKTNIPHFSHKLKSKVIKEFETDYKTNIPELKTTCEIYSASGKYLKTI